MLCSAAKPLSSHRRLQLPLPVPASPRECCGPSRLVLLTSTGDSPCSAGHYCKDPAYLVHNLPPSSATLCWSQMFTLATHAVSWPETLISPWQSNKAFPRILTPLSLGSAAPALLGPPLASVAAGSMEERD